MTTPDGATEDELAALYAAHAPFLRAWASRQGTGSSTPDDIVQETFLRVWRTRERVDPSRSEGELRAYLLTIARHVVIDAWRASERRPLVSVAPDTLTDLETAPAVLDEALDAWLIGEALSRISPDHRQVVRLLHHEGLTIRAVAERLGLPEGTIKSRSYYAVRALRSAFEEMGVTR